MNSIQTCTKSVLEGLGLLSFVRSMKTTIMILVKPEFRRQEFERRKREKASRERFSQFKQEYGTILRYRLAELKNEHKKVLVIGSVRLIEIELGLIKGLELAGYEPVVLVWDNPRVIKQYYDLTSVDEFLYWNEFFNPAVTTSIAKEFVEQFKTIEDLLAFEYAGARVGRNAASAALRILRLASLDLNSPIVREMVTEQVANGIASAVGAEKVIRIVKPSLALSIDMVYTGKGEIFDICLANKIDVIRWHPAHKSNTLMLKRYSRENRNDDPHSLSAKTWHSVQTMRWSEDGRKELEKEMYACYASGDWYGENATQFDKRFVDAEKIKSRIGLDPGKKTAIIFPHIFWDASFSYGANLFDNYEDWFIKTVQAACANEQVNWVIKIHPANLGKNWVDRMQTESAEVSALKNRIGTLPPHLFMIPADNDICTYSLFDLLDYCITVRGTVGIEAAVRGIPVLTAGTGRYDHKGFTIDSETSDEYLQKIADIQNIVSLSKPQRDLAAKYAYGLYCLRPLPLVSMTLEFNKANDPENYFAKTRFNIKNLEDWYTFSDLKAFSEWVKVSPNEDFLNSLFLEAKEIKESTN